MLIASRHDDDHLSVGVRVCGQSGWPLSVPCRSAPSGLTLAYHSGAEAAEGANKGQGAATRIPTSPEIEVAGCNIRSCRCPPILFSSPRACHLKRYWKQYNFLSFRISRNVGRGHLLSRYLSCVPLAAKAGEGFGEEESVRKVGTVA